MTNSELLQKCTDDSFAGITTFPEILRHMGSIGVRWYSANLILGMKTHYFDNGETIQTRWPEKKPITKTLPFNANAVVAAIRASQQGKIRYPEFIRQIAEAGAVVYTVHLHGRKAIYFSADGDFHIEQFPK